MRFQVGDYVLWWGRIMRVKKTDCGVLSEIMIGTQTTAEMVFPRVLSAHQRAWELDHDMCGWVPA